MVNGPALALIIVTSIWMVLLVLGLIFSLFLVVSGAAEDLQGQNQFVANGTSVVMVRMVFCCILLALNGVILMGALKMRNLQSYSLAMTAAILAAVPCCGLCYILDIPFGIWAIVVLNKPEVKDAFR